MKSSWFLACCLALGANSIAAAAADGYLERSAKFCAEVLSREPRVALDVELRFIAGHANQLIATKDRDLQRLGLRALNAYPPEPTAVRAGRSSLRIRLMELMQDEDAEVRTRALVGQLRYLRDSRWLDLSASDVTNPFTPDQHAAIREDLRRRFAKFFRVEIGQLTRERSEGKTVLHGTFAITNALARGLFDKPFAFAPAFPFSLKRFELMIGGRAKMDDEQQIEIGEVTETGVRGTFVLNLDNAVLDDNEAKSRSELAFAFLSEVGMIAHSILDVGNGRVRSTFFENVFRAR